MKNIIRIISGTVVILTVAVILALLAGYLFTRGSYTVPATADMDPGIPQIKLNGTVFHAEFFGREDAPLVIVLHGGPGADYRYLLPLKDLSDRYRVLFYDQRGTGLSSREKDGGPTLNSSISDLDAIIQHYGKGKKVNLIGHSWGAMLAAAYAGRHPGMVDHLVMAEPGFLTPDRARVFISRTRPSLSMSSLVFITTSWLRSLHVNGPDTQARNDFFLQQFMTAYTGDDFPLAGYFCHHRQSEQSRNVWRFGYNAMESIIRSGMNGNGDFTVDFTSGLEKLRRKVLFLSGECNTITGKDQQIHNMTHFPWAELVVIKNAGHYMISENPEESLSVIRHYLNQRL